MTRKRGENQSVDTKYATTLLCDALRYLKSGRVGAAHDLVKDAVTLLPDVNDAIQDEACFEIRKKRRGFSA